MMTNPEALAAAIAEDEVALERAREQVREINRTLARSQRIRRAYLRWARRPRCWWCGR